MERQDQKHPNILFEARRRLCDCMCGARRSLTGFGNLGQVSTVATAKGHGKLSLRWLYLLRTQNLAIALEDSAMEKHIPFSDNEAFYKQLLDIEAKKEEYFVDTGIAEAKDLPLRFLHHIGIGKDDIAHIQHKVVEESDFMLDFVEPMIMKL